MSDNFIRRGRYVLTDPRKKEKGVLKDGAIGEPRLIELVHENRDRPLEQITEIVTAAVDDWIGGAEQPDDVTLVLARAR